MSVLKNRFFPFYLALIIIAADYLSKYFVSILIPPMHMVPYWFPYGGIGVFKNFYGIEFSITHTANYGAAWGLFSSYQIPLMLVRGVLIVVLIIYSLFFNKHKNQQIPLALITAGAIGNVIDYFWFGHVIDMFHFILWGYDFPVFNIADSAITIGIGWLIILSFFEEKKLKKAKPRRN